MKTLADLESTRFVGQYVCIFRAQGRKADGWDLVIDVHDSVKATADMALGEVENIAPPGVGEPLPVERLLGALRKVTDHMVEFSGLMGLVESVSPIAMISGKAHQFHRRVIPPDMLTPDVGPELVEQRVNEEASRFARRLVTVDQGLARGRRMQRERPRRKKVEPLARWIIGHTAEEAMGSVPEHDMMQNLCGPRSSLMDQGGQSGPGDKGW